MRKIFISSYLLVTILLIASCGNIFGPSQKILDAATKAIKERSCATLECRDFKYEIHKTVVTDADKANGISERWSFVCHFVRKDSEWIDVTALGIVVVKNGEIEVGATLL